MLDQYVRAQRALLEVEPLACRAAVEGDDEACDDLLNAYESEDGVVR